MVDTMGRIFLPVLFGLFTDPSSATSIGSALASMLIYLMMAAILAVRPKGLFPAHG
jgi:branched-chain amino acid transport system permease protein